jgi:prophage DNA circulation protein
VIPLLVDVEDKLTKAVGVSALRTADIKNSQVRAINQILDRAQIQGNEATNIAKTIREENKEIGAEKERLIAVLEAASADRKKIEEIAKQAEKLARGNSSQNALENLVRTARSKSDEINEVLSSVKASQEAATSAAKMAFESSEKSKASLDGLDASDKKAFGILNNVTQAGLAGAYKTEREHLQKQQDRFSLVF